MLKNLPNYFLNIDIKDIPTIDLIFKSVERKKKNTKIILKLSL